MCYCVSPQVYVASQILQIFPCELGNDEGYMHENFTLMILCYSVTNAIHIEMQNYLLSGTSVRAASIKYAVFFLTQKLCKKK